MEVGWNANKKKDLELSTGRNIHCSLLTARKHKQGQSSSQCFLRQEISEPPLMGDENGVTDGEGDEKKNKKER